jgi:chromosome segregation ATPase
LWKENTGLRSLIAEMRAELSSSEERLIEHSDQLAGLRANLISGEQKIQELSAQVKAQEQAILELEARKDHPLVFVLAQTYRFLRRIGRFVLDRLSTP